MALETNYIILSSTATLSDFIFLKGEENIGTIASKTP
tara:strand:- start:15 stop:125 length:111 start_codon:yes stop_codon:yes gene_type:complete